MRTATSAGGPAIVSASAETARDASMGEPAMRDGQPRVRDVAQPRVAEVELARDIVQDEPSHQLFDDRAAVDVVELRGGGEEAEGEGAADRGGDAGGGRCARRQ